MCECPEGYDGNGITCTGTNYSISNISMKDLYHLKAINSESFKLFFSAHYFILF